MYYYCYYSFRGHEASGRAPFAAGITWGCVVEARQPGYIRGFGPIAVSTRVLEG